MPDRHYYARSASDKTDDWPFWYVADERRGGINVTAELRTKRDGSPFPQILPDGDGLLGVIAQHTARLPLLPPWDAVQLAMWGNANA